LRRSSIATASTSVEGGRKLPAHMHSRWLITACFVPPHKVSSQRSAAAMWSHHAHQSVRIVMCCRVAPDMCMVVENSARHCGMYGPQGSISRPFKGTTAVRRCRDGHGIAGVGAHQQARHVLCLHAVCMLRHVVCLEVALSFLHVACIYVS
jgi:hypothetical protein